MSALNKDLYRAIKAMAKELSFADFGSASAGPVSQLCRNSYNDALEKGHFAGMQYLNNNLEKRFNPTLLVEGATTVLVFLAPYSLPDNFTPPAGISQYALGKDYHTIIKGKLFKIMEFLAANCQDFQGRAFTDSAPVMEREWAVRAGLGFIGKNNFLISKSCGVKNFIGVIICNAPIPSTMEMEPQKHLETCGECGECQRCLQGCPTGALCAPYTIDARKCISYHTIENRNLGASLENGEIASLHGKYFGCDNCSNACPWNSRNLPGWEEFRTHYEILWESGNEWWRKLSEEEFKKKFKDSPLLRGGLKNIRTALEWAIKGKRMSNLKFSTPVAIQEAAEKIDYNSRILMLGSCFSTEIGQILKDYRFDVMVNPFGVLYNPCSIANSVKRLLNPEPFTANEVIRTNPTDSNAPAKFASFSHHSSFARLTPEEFLVNANESLTLAASFLNNADTVIITLGTAWTFRNISTCKVVSNCHKRLSKEFKRELLSIDECYAELLETANSLKGKKIIFTVSPIRHLKDTAHGNQISKSTLLLAVERVIAECNWCSYFPSYEIMMDELRDYRYYAEDLVHPSALAVKYIFEKFKESNISTPAFKQMENNMRLTKAENHIQK